MQIFCPRCASQAPQGQRFCRNCGMKLDVIVDAMEGRRAGTIDFETLKGDLLELGKNLRTGFETAKEEVKKTRNLKKQAKRQEPWGFIGDAAHWGAARGAQIGESVGHAIQTNAESRAERRLKKEWMKKLPAMRKHSLQQGVLQMLSGGALAGAWFAMLERAGQSGLLASLDTLLQSKLDGQVVGLAPIFEMLWVFALIPVATGLGHLINGLFFAPKPEELRLENYLPQPAMQPVAAMPAMNAVPSAVPVDEASRNTNSMEPLPQPVSVIEDETKRFASREAA